MKKVINWLIKQPDNPNLPRPIFVIGLIIVIIFAFFRFYGGNLFGNNSNVPSTGKEGTFISRLVDNVKDKVDNIFNKESDFEDITLPPLPNISEHSQQLDEELLKEVDSLGKYNYEMAEIELEGIGRKDPMRPLKTPNIEIFRYEAYKDDVFFYPIGTLKENAPSITAQENRSDSDNQTSEEVQQEPVKKEIVKYRTWEEASVEKIPSKEAIEYREKQDSSRNTGAYIEDDLINDSVDYFKGMTLDQVILDAVYLDDKLIPTATFLSLGGEYKGLQTGDYLNDIYYIVDINYLKQEVTLEYVSKNTIKRETLSAYHIVNQDGGFKK